MGTKKTNLFILIVMIYFIAAEILLGIVLSIFDLAENITLNILISQFFIVGLPAIIYILIKKEIHIPIAKIKLLDIIIIIALALFIMPFLGFINVISQLFVENQVQDMLGSLLDINFFLVVFLTGVLPSIFEELLTRGIIVSSYKNATVLSTILVSGLFFGFIHMNINQFLYAFVMGVVMCYVVMITGSVFSSMIMHFVVNTTGTVFLHGSLWLARYIEDQQMIDSILNPIDPTSNDILITAVSSLLFAGITIPLAGLMIYFLLKRYHKPFKGSFFKSNYAFVNNLEENQDSPKEKATSLSLIFSAVLFLVFSVIIEIATRYMT